VTQQRGLPCLCTRCFEPIDYGVAARAYRRGEEYRHACGRRLVTAAADRWWERRRDVATAS